MGKDTMSKDGMKKDDAIVERRHEKGCNVQGRYEEGRRDVQGSHEEVTAAGSQVNSIKPVQISGLMLLGRNGFEAGAR